MKADEQTIRHTRAAALLGAATGRLPGRARRFLGRFAGPYRRRRARELELHRQVAHIEGQLAVRLERHGEQIERLEDFVRELVTAAESLRRQGESASAMARSVQPLADELYALPYMAESPFEAMSSPVGEVLGFSASTSLEAGGSDYARFEDLFRGPAERVAESQRPYLSLVRDSQPVLDLGCGRGEFLTLLAEHGIEGHGVDGDEGMVARCRQLGLQVSQGDVNEYLSSVPDASLGAIFSAQLIEHLPHAELDLLLSLSLRKLRPGGLFIAETVNPHRLASLKTFWVDLTHQHPIFPEVALATCAIAGFASGYVFAPGYDDYQAARFSAPAYAVVATCPAAGRDV
jgi:SAM-dependent methyltransferase